MSIQNVDWTKKYLNYPIKIYGLVTQIDFKEQSS